MTTQNEYAALAAHVYNDQRGGGNDPATNRLELPAGWQNLSLLGFAAGDNLNSNPFSFTGGAYLNQSTGEVVIAYKGTDFLVEFSGRAWNTLVDLVTDAGLALAKKSVSLYNLQQIAASSYYLAVKEWALQNGHDPSKISFTDTRTDTAGTEGDVVDAGAGDDWVMGSWAGDMLQLHRHRLLSARAMNPLTTNLIACYAINSPARGQKHSMHWSPRRARTHAMRNHARVSV
jgi:hypothetical protein